MSTDLHLRVTGEQAISAEVFALRRDGYIILEDMLPSTAVASLDAELSPIFETVPFCQGGFYGERTKRFGGLLSRSEQSADLIQHPKIIAIAEEILSPWCDTIQLNLGQAIEIHPGALSQFPHRDQDMWRGPTGELEYLINVMWPITDFREENGATLIWPASHGAAAAQDPPSQSPAVMECDPGSAIVFLGSTLHCAGANRTQLPRRGVIASYCLGWLKPYENQWLVYPPAVARHFSTDLAGLIGYRQHRPNLGNFEGQCPSVLLNGNLPQTLNAVDALRPDQAAAVAEFVESQKGRLPS